MSSPDIGLANWFLQRALRTPERTALAFESKTWSYAQMQQRIEQLAGRLHGLGVRRGDRVAFLGLNQPMFLFALFASARLGAIFVPLNFRLTGPEVAANEARGAVIDCFGVASIPDCRCMLRSPQLHVRRTKQCE